MGGQVKDGVATDRIYNALAIRYNGLLDWVACVREAVNSGNKPICEGGN